ncbi:archaellin/type IV pilin N-terminal domain-containing protein [Pyrolobus fumarii]|uniref:archaellin/type IV pilin N-terminal domain-containing protein n=1 Tax=Pyrolobus fumarii TaxID=54252 RepID=UPI00068ED13B|nr:archaellin/type IV pilin N-terminal domain-containing protein [Pyrolobus fumarii]
MFRSYKAISPVIATIIIIAVTIAISVAVAGWLMGLWTGYTAKPALRIIDATLYTNGTLLATVINEGTGDANVESITIGDVKCTYSDAGLTSPDLVKPGERATLKWTCTAWSTAGFQPGGSYVITIMTTDGFKFTGNVYVKQA